MSNTEEIEKNLGVVFSDKELLTQAMMHRSFVVEHGLGDLASNERLEFLGDAVLELIITTHLYEAFPTQPEGILTQWRAIVVNAKNLDDAAKKISLSKYIFLSRGEKLSGGGEKERIRANVLEAVIGAIYIDQGYEVSKEFVERAVLQDVPELIEAYKNYNPKGVLQEKVQALKKVTPEYRILEELGPDHAKKFLAGIFLEGKLIGQGDGMSKKEAEEDAAKDALEHFHQQTSIHKS